MNIQPIYANCIINVKHFENNTPMIQKLQTLNHSKYTVQILSKSQRHVRISYSWNPTNFIIPKRLYFPRKYHFPRTIRKVQAIRQQDTRGAIKFRFGFARQWPSIPRCSNPLKRAIPVKPRCTMWHIALNAPLATLVNLHRSHKTMILSIESTL